MEGADSVSARLAEIVSSLDGKTPKGTVWKSYFSAVTRFVKRSNALRDAAAAAFEQDADSYTSNAKQLAVEHTYSSTHLPSISEKALRVPGAKHDARARQLSASILTHAGHVGQLAAACPPPEALHVLDTAARRQCVEHLLQAHALYAPGECLPPTLAVQDPLLHLSLLCQEAGCTPLAAFHALQYERHRAWGQHAVQDAGIPDSLQAASSSYCALRKDPRLLCARGMSGPRLAQGVHIIIEGAGQGGGQPRRGEIGRQVGTCATLGVHPQLPYIGPPSIPSWSSGSSGGGSAPAPSQPLSLGKSDSTEPSRPSRSAGRRSSARFNAWQQYMVRMDGHIPSSTPISSGGSQPQVHAAGVAYRQVLSLPLALQAHRYGASAATVVDPRRILTCHVLYGVLHVIHEEREGRGGEAGMMEHIQRINELCTDVRRLLHLWPRCFSGAACPRAVLSHSPSCPWAGAGAGGGSGVQDHTTALSPLWLVRLMALLAHTDSSSSSRSSRLCLLLLLHLALRLAQACRLWCSAQSTQAERDSVPMACIPLSAGLRLLAQCVSQDEGRAWLCVPPSTRGVGVGKRRREEKEGEEAEGQQEVEGMEARLQWAGRHLLSNCIALAGILKPQLQGDSSVSSTDAGTRVGTGTSGQPMLYIEDAVLTGWSAHLPPAAPVPLWLPHPVPPPLLSALVSCELHGMGGDVNAEAVAIAQVEGREHTRGRFARIQEALAYFQGTR